MRAPAGLILLVDDEEWFTATLADVLEDQGYGVLQAADGESALAALRRYRPDLVFLDLKMPGVGGEEVCRQLAGHPGSPVIVVVTATATGEDALRLRQLGARDVLLKPAPIEQLLRIARSVCRPRRSAGVGAPQRG